MGRSCFLPLILLTVTAVYPQKKSTIFERKENFIDIRDRLELYSMILRKYSTVPIWQTVMSSPEYDEAILLPDNNLLFGTIDLKPFNSHKISGHNKYAIYPEYNALYKIDSKTGEIIWVYGRTGQLSATSYQIINVSEKIVSLYHTEKDKAEIKQIDLEKGIEVSSLPIELNSKYVLLYANSILFVFNSIKQEIKYEGYSLTDNKLLYSSLLPGISDACSVEQIGGWIHSIFRWEKSCSC